MILNSKNEKESLQFFCQILDLGIGFKNQNQIKRKTLTEKIISDIQSEDIPVSGENVKIVLAEFENNILPYCVNVSNPKFVGFPYAGNSVAAIGADIMKSFSQQNLMNQDWSPIATQMELSLIKWLRKLVGYKIATKKIKNIFFAGGMVTTGGSMSNIIALLLAKKNIGNDHQKRKYILIPKGITHYSINKASDFFGCGEVIEVDSKDFKYNLDDLKEKLAKFNNKILAVVAFAGDSKTGTIDDFQKIRDVVKSYDSKIWLHADACHGFCLEFSDKLKYKLNGIEEFDSISADPHKDLFTPYPLSFLLFKNSGFLRIMADSKKMAEEEGLFDFGRITPFLGSRAWDSLKLWFLLKNLGSSGICKYIDQLNDVTQFAWETLSNDMDFRVIKEPDFNSVLFYYCGSDKLQQLKLDNLNYQIYKKIKNKGEFFLHSSKICLDTQKTKQIRVLRLMVGNPNCDKTTVLEMVNYLKKIANEVKIRE